MICSVGVSEPVDVIAAIVDAVGSSVKIRAPPPSNGVPDVVATRLEPPVAKNRATVPSFCKRKRVPVPLGRATLDVVVDTDREAEAPGLKGCGFDIESSSDF